MKGYKNNMKIESSAPAYNLLGHTQHEIGRFPVSSFTLSFKHQDIQQAFFKSVYLSSQGNWPSKQFKYQLAMFTLFLQLINLVYFLGRIVMYNEIISNTGIFIYHFIGFLIGMTLIIFGVVAIIRHQMAFKQHKFILFGIVAFQITFYLMGDQRVLCTLFDVQIPASFPNSLLIVLAVIYLVPAISYNNFLCQLVLSVYVVLIYLTVLLFFRYTDLYVMWIDFYVLLIALAKILSQCYQTDYRLKQLFWRTYREELFDTIKDWELKQLSNQLSPQIQKVLCVLTAMHELLKQACKFLIYNEFKIKIKDCILCIKQLKEVIPNMTLKNINIEQNLDIDEQDRIFISENFLESQEFKQQSFKQMDTSQFFEATNIDLGHQSVQKLLSKFGKDWTFDVLFLNKLGLRSIQVVGKYLTDVFNVTQTLNTQLNKVTVFFERLSQGYGDLPYHNESHAADVTHTMFFLIFNTKLSIYTSPLDLIAICIASLSHDLGHSGLNNRFLINSKNKLAIRYNDISVLENMHSSYLFKILTNEQTNILENIEKEDWNRMRKTIIDMILSTDMSRHFQILGVMKAKLTVMKDFQFFNPTDKLLIYSFILKCSDLGHSAKILELHQKWTAKVVEEFFNQGDLEKELGLSVSMYCDRQNTDVGKSQYGFIRNICLPMFFTLDSALDSHSIRKNCIQNLKQNKRYWKQHQFRRNTMTEKQISGIDERGSSDSKIEQESQQRVYKKTFTSILINKFSL